MKKALRKTSARRAERADKAKVRGGQGAEDVRASGGPFSLPDDVDFDAALHRAIMHVPPTPEPLRPVRAHVQPLLDYIKAKPLYHAHDRQKLAGLVRRLFRRIDELERKRGRPARESNKETPAHELAEGYAVQLVRLKHAQYRRKYHCERVPAAETDRMIQEAKPEAARMHKAKVWQMRGVQSPRTR